MPFNIGPAGDSAMRLSFQEAPSPRLTQILLQLQRTAQRYFLESLSDSVVGYATLTLFFTPLSLQRDQVTVWLEKTALSLCDARQVLDTPSTETVVLPVFYDPAVAPDLISVADELGLTIDALITLHSATPYFAFATGFAPGFCYLGTLDSRLKTQRLSTPRLRVPAGAVAIADQQTAVYPCESPGGWQIIGACPVTLFDMAATPASKLAVGDSVRFESIDEHTYRALGGRFANADAR